MKQKYYTANFLTVQGMEAKKSIDFPAVLGFQSVKDSVQKEVDKDVGIYTYTIIDPDNYATDFSRYGNPLGTHKVK